MKIIVIAKNEQGINALAQHRNDTQNESAKVRRSFVRDWKEKYAPEKTEFITRGHTTMMLNIMKKANKEGVTALIFDMRRKIEEAMKTNGARLDTDYTIEVQE